MIRPAPRNAWFTARGILFALVAASCLRAWIGPVSIETTAQAQIPDSGLQRKQQLEEARLTNQLLSEIKVLLEKGTFNVRLQGADNQAPAPAKNQSADK